MSVITWLRLTSQGLPGAATSAEKILLSPSAITAPPFQPSVPLSKVPLFNNSPSESVSVSPPPVSPSPEPSESEPSEKLILSK